MASRAEMEGPALDNSSVAIDRKGERTRQCGRWMYVLVGVCGY